MLYPCLPLQHRQRFVRASWSLNQALMHTSQLTIFLQQFIMSMGGFIGIAEHMEH